MENVKRSMKSRIVVVLAGLVAVGGLGSAALSNNVAKADVTPTYSVVTHLTPKAVVVNPVASSEITPYPANIKDKGTYTIANSNSPYVRVTTQHQELYRFFTSLNTSQSGTYTLTDGVLRNNATGQAIKLAPVDITEITRFAHPNQQSVAPADTMLLTQADYNYLSSQDGLQITVNSTISGFSE